MEAATQNTEKRDTRSREELTELLAGLDTKTVVELQELYNQFEGKAITTRNKPFLVKKVSTTIREQLDRTNEKEEVEATNPEDSSLTEVSPTSKPKRQRRRDSRLPPPGTILAREYKGVRHEVLVLDDGFTYNDEHFGSLSKIAKHIAGGTSWNGFLFFRNALMQASQNQ